MGEYVFPPVRLPASEYVAQTAAAGRGGVSGGQQMFTLDWRAGARMTEALVTVLTLTGCALISVQEPASSADNAWEAGCRVSPSGGQ